MYHLPRRSGQVSFQKRAGAQSKRAQSWGDWNKLSCSLLFTNPPFAGDIDDIEILDAYEAQQNPTAKKQLAASIYFWSV